MVEGRDLLDGDLAPAGAVDGGADDAIRALANDIKYLVLRAYLYYMIRKKEVATNASARVYGRGREVRTDVEADLARCRLAMGCCVCVF